MRSILYLLSLFWVAATAHPEVKVLVAGDSTVVTSPPKYGWGDYIGAHLNDKIDVVNLAMGGRSTKTFIQEGRWDDLLSKTTPGDFIFVQFGHNDSHAPGNPESTDADTDYKEYLRKYADDAKNAGAKLIFVTSPHRRKFRPDGILSQELLPYRNAMIAVAEEKHVPFVDLYTLTGDEITALGDEGASFLYCGPLPDRTHFSEAGATWLAKLIVETVQSQRMMPAEMFSDK